MKIHPVYVIDRIVNNSSMHVTFFLNCFDLVIFNQNVITLIFQ